MTCIKPVGETCCGCPTALGVNFILMLHFAVDGMLLLQAVGRALPAGAGGALRTFGPDSAVACYSLVGLAIISAAFYGVAARRGALVRTYLFYMVFTVLADSYFVVQAFVLTDVCEGARSISADTGPVLACGITRALGGGVAAACLALQLYFVYLVWSYSEELAQRGAVNHPGLLADEAVALSTKRRSKDPFAAALYGALQDSVAATPLCGRSPGFFAPWRAAKQPCRL
eukprot:CAMPEP_0176073688 /NCGR_PEP_ID=MMETSP0120_2-20121206/36819_1 /TAXON_ID=160619 /ORGANISM="Kryptoperidinium foliaceum, Strain CCMP 1326" /LENGTH=228 /DNA_ID=CAMNT_0017407371 /DNA_START=53 /DNA_END=736 /DNA_ORIENTATION=+